MTLKSVIETIRLGLKYMYCAYWRGKWRQTLKVLTVEQHILFHVQISNCNNMVKLIQAVFYWYGDGFYLKRAWCVLEPVEFHVSPYLSNYNFLHCSVQHRVYCPSKLRAYYIGGKKTWMLNTLKKWDTGSDKWAAEKIRTILETIYVDLVNSQE